MFEITYDNEALEYLQSKQLIIVLFDDNAEVTNGSDEIGVCRVPLTPLITGVTTHQRY